MSGTEKPDAIPVPAKVLEGIEAVRRSGLTNMLARDVVVAQIAAEMGFEESARWVQQRRDLYARAIFHGFQVIRTETDREVLE